MLDTALLKSDTCTCSIRDVAISNLFILENAINKAVKVTRLLDVNTSRFLKNSVYVLATSLVSLAAFSISAVPQTILRATVGSRGLFLDSRSSNHLSKDNYCLKKGEL